MQQKENIILNRKTKINQILTESGRGAERVEWLWVRSRKDGIITTKSVYFAVEIVKKPEVDKNGIF